MKKSDLTISLDEGTSKLIVISPKKENSSDLFNLTGYSCSVRAQFKIKGMTTRRVYLTRGSIGADNLISINLEPEWSVNCESGTLEVRIYNGSKVYGVIIADIQIKEYREAFTSMPNVGSTIVEGE